ncbi:MAG: insulinase family protein [Candidatus Latescibacteria bacterium]|nr:insulinase family protein [Candidatus Latescibacterota bacterium]
MMIERIQKVILANGLTVLIDPSAANDVVALLVALKMGCAFEGEDEAGISGVTQRLLPKGTTTRSAEQIATDIESLGAKVATNAGKDYGVISLIVTRDRLAEGLPLFFDILLNANFPEHEVAIEKELTLQKIKAKDDQTLPRAMDLMNEAYYQTHPYHKPPLGYTETVENVSRGMIEQFYRTHLVPERTIVVAVGNLDPEEFVASVDRALGRILSSEGERRGSSEVTALAPVERSGPSQKTLTRDIKAAWISIGYGAPSINDRDYAPMEVLEAVMGGSMNSRLFIELRDKRGLAYQVGSAYSARPGPSLYVAYIGTSGDQYAIARDGIFEEVQKIREEPITAEELLLAQRYIKGTFIMGQERNINRASLLAQYELLGLGYSFIEDYPKVIDKVAIEDVLSVARQYLDTERYAIGAVVPENTVVS